jgi:hypothetical protein
MHVWRVKCALFDVWCFAFWLVSELVFLLLGSQPGAGDLRQGGSAWPKSNI